MRLGWQTVMNVLNMINPAYWIKKVTVDKLYEIILVKIGLAIIAIVGKKHIKFILRVSLEPKDLESDIDDLYESIKGYMSLFNRKPIVYKEQKLDESFKIVQFVKIEA